MAAAAEARIGPKAPSTAEEVIYHSSGAQPGSGFKNPEDRTLPGFTEYQKKDRAGALVQGSSSCLESKDDISSARFSVEGAEGGAAAENHELEISDPDIAKVKRTEQPQFVRRPSDIVSLVARGGRQNGAMGRNVFGWILVLVLLVTVLAPCITFYVLLKVSTAIMH